MHEVLLKQPSRRQLDVEMTSQSLVSLDNKKNQDSYLERHELMVWLGCPGIHFYGMTDSNGQKLDSVEIN